MLTNYFGDTGYFSRVNQSYKVYAKLGRRCILFTTTN